MAPRRLFCSLFAALPDMNGLHALVDAFNRGSLDVPAGFFAPGTAYVLNHRSYESILGGSPDDPLIRMLARGVAGYRSAAKALQYAVPGAAMAVEALSEPDGNGVRAATVRIEGRLRSSGEPFTTHFILQFRCAGAQVMAVEATCSDQDLAVIAASRRA